MQPRPSKTHVSVVAAVFAAVVGVVSREARASDFLVHGFVEGDPSVVLPVAIVTILTTSDIATAVRGERGNQVVAVAEIIVTVPQMAFAGVVLSGARFNVDAIEPAALFVWAGALCTHGVLTLALDPSEAAPKPLEIPADHPHITLAPAMLGDGSRAALAPGLVAVGRF